MPILRGATTFSRFRVDADARASTNWKKSLTPGLRQRAFEPLDRQGPADRSAGFVELEDHEARTFSAGSLFQGEFALFTFRVDEFRIPASVVRTELERWKKEFVRENARPPGRREKADAKGEIRHTLRATAPITTRTFDVSWHLGEAELHVWAASRKLVDEVQAAVEQACRVKLVPLVPVVVAGALGIAEKTLQPTPLLSLPDARPEVRHGKA